MSSKAEKTSYHSPQQPRLSIFFRNPLLLKVVAWLGSLSFIGSTGVVWADLKPISTSQTEEQALTTAAASRSALRQFTKPGQITRCRCRRNKSCQSAAFTDSVSYAIARVRLSGNRSLMDSSHAIRALLLLLKDWLRYAS